jgi:nitrilase
LEHIFPKFRAAAVQAASVFMDREATTDKACDLIREAAGNGARLIVFPESYIAGYPHWAWLHTVKDGQKFFPLLVKSSVTVPSDITDRLCRTAKDCDAYVAIGINETSSSSYGEIFNTLLFIGPDGSIISKHRKLIPTFYEKLVWSFGDGSALRTHKTDIGCVGMLICGENANPLARFALIAEAEQVHIANFPALPQSGQVGGYSMRKAIEIRGAAHSFEGKVFTVASTSIIDDTIRDLIGDTPEHLEALQDGGTGFTGIFGPNGMVVAGPLPDNEEGIVYGDLDLEDGIGWKQYHDYAGNYNRFDILSLNVNRTPISPLHVQDSEAPASDPRPLHGGNIAPLMERLQDRLKGVEDAGLRRELERLVNEIVKV